MDAGEKLQLTGTLIKCGLMLAGGIIVYRWARRFTETRALKWGKYGK